MNNTLHTPGPQWVKVKRKRKFDPVTVAAPDLLETLQDICAMIVSPNDTRADILAHAQKAIAKAKGEA